MSYWRNQSHKPDLNNEWFRSRNNQHSKSRRSNNEEYQPKFLQFLSTQSATERGVFMKTDIGKEVFCRRAGLTEDGWENKMMEFFDDLNKRFYDIKIKYSKNVPSFAIDLYLAENVGEITLDCEAIFTNLSMKFDPLTIWHGRQLPLALRKHSLARKSDRGWVNAQIESCKHFKNHTNLPQKYIVDKYLALLEDKKSKAKITPVDYDAWKQYEYDKNYVTTNVKIAVWLNKYIPQNVYDKFFVCTDLICMHMFTSMGKPISSSYINGRCANHKSATFGKSCPSLPNYMYNKDDHDVVDYGEQSFVNEYISPLKIYVSYPSHAFILAPFG